MTVVSLKSSRSHTLLSHAFSTIVTLSALFGLGAQTAESPTTGTISVRYFNIRGSTQAELLDQLREHGPIDQFGIRRHAYTRWHIQWRWPTRGSEQQRYQNVQVQYHVKILLPRWRGVRHADPKLRREWRRYHRSIVRHEFNHASFVVRNAPLIPMQIKAGVERGTVRSVNDAHRVAQEVLHKIRRLDALYDDHSDHGKREGVALLASPE